MGDERLLDRELEDLPADLRWREWMLRVEAVIFAAAGGWQHRSRIAYAPAIGAARAPTRLSSGSPSEHEAAVLTAIAYLQPVTRGELSKMFSTEVSRDTIASLRDAGFLGSGPRSPTPGAPYTYVTTKHFLSVFGLETLRELPDLERLEDAGLLSRQRLAREEFAEEGDEQD